MPPCRGCQLPPRCHEPAPGLPLPASQRVSICALFGCLSLCLCNCRPSFCFAVQVICKDWSNLAGKNYIILNMTENIDCVSAELGGDTREGWEGPPSVGRGRARGTGRGLA